MKTYLIFNLVCVRGEVHVCVVGHVCWCVSVSVSHMCMHMPPEVRGFASPEAGATGACWSPDMGAMEELIALSTFEPFLHAQIFKNVAYGAV